MSGPDVTSEAYRPATLGELQASLHQRTEGLQDMAKEYEEAKLAMRMAVQAYRSTPSDEQLNAVLNATSTFKEIYAKYSKNGIHHVGINPSKTDEVQIMPVRGWVYRQLTFDHYRDRKLPTPVGTLTYPDAYPAQWFYRPATIESTVNSSEPAALGAEVGVPQKGGSEDSKKQLSSRQIGAIIAARRANRFH